MRNLWSIHELSCENSIHEECKLVLERVNGGWNAAATVDKSLGREGVDRHDRSMAKQAAP